VWDVIGYKLSMGGVLGLNGWNDDGGLQLYDANEVKISGLCLCNASVLSDD